MKQGFIIILLFISFIIDLSGLNPGQARDFYNRGLDALEMDDYIMALDEFRGAIQINSSYADARFGAAKALYFLEEYSEAYKEIIKAKSLAAHETRYTILEARILTALGDYDSAVTLYNSILAEKPYLPEANQGLGEVYAILGMSERANSAYGKSLEYSPGNLRVLLQLVILHDTAREKQTARNALQEALRLYPDDYEVHIRAAEHYALYGEWEQASKQLEEAAALAEGNMRRERVARLKARLALKRGDPVAALSFLENFTGTDDLFLRARVYRELDQEEKAQEVLRLLQRQAPDDEINRIFRETALVQTVGGFAEHRSETASWHIKKAKRLEEAFYYRQALVSYRRARRIDNTSVDYWLRYANLIRLMGFPGKYRDELNAAVGELVGYTDKQEKIQERIELLEHSITDNIARRWNIADPWNLPDTSWRVAVFINPEQQSLPMHDGAGASLGAYFADLMDGRTVAAVINLDGGFFPGVREISSFTEAFRLARDSTDYFIMLNFTETERTFSAGASLYLSRTGELVSHSVQLRTGLEKVFDAIELLVQDINTAIPRRMTILAVSGDKLLLNRGRWHGMDNTNPSVILKEGAGKSSAAGEGIEYDPSNFLGTVEVTASSESLSEGVITRSGDFNFIAVGDEVFAVSVPEAVKKNDFKPMPDPAFRSRLLSVP